MKKGLLIVALLCLICIPFSILAFAEETEAPSEPIVLLVGDETNAETGTYTWKDALQYAETNYANGAYTVRLTKDIFVGEAFTINKPLKLTIDLAGYTLSSNTGSVKTDSETGTQSWSAGVTVKLGSGSSKCVITTMTSVEGGTWNNVYQNSLNNATSYDSLFSIAAGVSPVTFNFGGAGSKALTVNGNMLVTGSSSSFQNEMIADIHIDGGSYKLTNGIYQVQAKSTMTSCAIYNVDAKNATVSVNSRLFYRNGSGCNLNAASIMSFTNCTVKSWSKALSIGNAAYTGSITMTGCTIENIVFDLRTASAASVVFGEGCVFTTPDATTTISSVEYTTFNADKTGFANANTNCAEGCVLVNDTETGVIRVEKSVPEIDASILLVADETNEELSTYTWIDALAKAASNPEAAYTVRLTKDIAVDTQFELAAQVDLTIDLAGYTLTSSVDTISLGSKASGSVITILTSVEGGTWSNAKKSPFTIGTSGSPFTINYGSEDSEALNIVANMLVVGGTNFKNKNQVANINLFAGTYTLMNGIYQVYGKNENTCAIFKVNVKDAVIAVSSRFLFAYPFSSEYTFALNEQSFMNFENCTLKSSTDEPVSFANRPYQGTITMTGCTIENLAFDSIVAEAEAVVFGEGCVFTTPEAKGDYAGNTFNEAKDLFANANMRCAEGCVIVNADDGLVRVMKASDACRIDFTTPAGTETRYWLAGSTPVYTGELKTTIGDSVYSFSFSDIKVAAPEGATYEGKLVGGTPLSASLTLYSSIDLHVYIREASEITAINGKSIDSFDAVINNGETYYKLSFKELAPKDAAAPQSIIITVDYEGESIDTERTVSVANYVKKLMDITMDTNTSYLGVALLGYIKAASEYFGTATDETNAALDAVIRKHAIYEWSAENNDKIYEIPEGLSRIKAVALNLGNTPGFAVAVAKGVESVRVAGVSYTVDPELVTEVNGEECCYVITHFGAFSMMDDFDIEADGEQLTFNLDTYLNYMGNPSYAGALYGYALAARMYLDYPIAKQEQTALAKDKTYRILFIGNSYTHTDSMPTRFFLPIAESEGYSVEVDYITKGGHQLIWHADPTDVCGAQVEAALTGDKQYDFVVLQDSSSNTALDDYQWHLYDPVRTLVAKIRAHGAEPILYATSARELGTAFLENRGWSHEHMLYKVAAAYTAIAEELDLRVCYAGFTLAEVYLNTDIRVFKEGDSISHPTTVGMYGVALTLFSEIFGVDPQSIAYESGLKGTTSETEAILKKAAAMAVLYTPSIPEAYRLSSEGVTNPDQEEVHMLNTKKFIFIGNSYIYWGKTVLGSSSNNLEDRQHDEGYFYQLCKRMGANVDVTNWTFGGHGVGSIFSDSCSHCNGCDHKEYLTDRYYDYVVISPGAETGFDETMQKVMAFFKEANPDVQFILLGTACAYGINGTDSPDYMYQQALFAPYEDQGVLIADWGGLVSGILNGTYTVPGATQEFTRSSFIVKDKKHGTMLTGYLEAMFVYCVITGESATTLPYSFWDETSLREEFDVEKFLNQNTSEDYTSNFVEIFNSEADMKGLQQLVDQVIKEKPYRNESSSPSAEG